jgi:hypothetical protein
MKEQEALALKEEAFRRSGKEQLLKRILSKAEKRRTVLFKLAREAELKELDEEDFLMLHPEANVRYFRLPLVIYCAFRRLKRKNQMQMQKLMQMQMQYKKTKKC